MNKISLLVVLCYLALAQPIIHADIQADLLAYWTFDEGKGDTIKDN